MSNGYFVSSPTVRTTRLPRSAPHEERPRRPLVIIGGGADLSVQEGLCLGDALKARHAQVEVFRTDDDFRIKDFISALNGCSWFLLAIGEQPEQELEMLREVQRVTIKPPKIGIICLKDHVRTTAQKHIGGIVDLVVRKTHLDQSLTSPSRSHHLMTAESLLLDKHVQPIARVVVPDSVFNKFC